MISGLDPPPAGDGRLGGDLLRREGAVMSTERIETAVRASDQDRDGVLVRLHTAFA
jgi:hypothetical protein